MIRAWVQRSFRNRIFLTVLLVALVPLLLCDVLMTQVMIARSERALRLSAQAEMTQLSGHLEQLLTQCGEAARELARTEGNVLLTTGAKELGAFSPIAPERCYPRVLPTQEGIAACEAAGVPHRNIIAMQGPFSRALNEALIRQFEIHWLVTKDGGAAGGFAEKVQAAQSTGAQLVVLRRPPEQGQTAQEILNLCKEKML